jgi:hypothetical protein
MEKYDRFGSPSRPIRYQDRKPRESGGGGGGVQQIVPQGEQILHRPGYTVHRRKIILTESKAECRYLKKLTP